MLQYAKIRQVGGKLKRGIPVTPRMLESLIRLAVARCRARLGNEVTEDDVSQAARVLVSAQFYDPEGKNFIIEEEATSGDDTDDDGELAVPGPSRKPRAVPKRRREESNDHPIRTQ
mmetsp:Transcript_50736/g.130881  ORF Transcript_50736/g.130881 Transcript_50736/m.130881 type:complete len:116 (+) Transcript_50736:1963-2310(+)|eukprot:CAMPEP_0113872966 /NCGR_PEP_ID=MMETSP0780_2-20120614/3510_1 /TAXON_ID=652834 /ORGANISM="Palpitomonas bilix" /LENGTH=115 /DNA_ID=CAMNT_0000858563 /DNA_START=577 /DNA_END=924 /DNA_ORIENTATION=- /assembly_acc=CAM_ASM_000599